MLCRCSLLECLLVDARLGDTMTKTPSGLSCCCEANLRSISSFRKPCGVVGFPRSSLLSLLRFSVVFSHAQSPGKSAETLFRTPLSTTAIFLGTKSQLFTHRHAIKVPVEYDVIF